MRVSHVATKFGIVAGALTACAALVAACGDVGGVTELSVGSTPSGADGGTAGSSLVTASPDATSPDTTSTGTVMDLLNTKCAAEPGQADYFTSAAELTTKLRGSWYHCPSNDPSDWQLPAGTGMAFEFSSTSTWAFLDYASTPQTFAPSSDPARSGSLVYLVFAGTLPEGGPISDGSVQPDSGGYMNMEIPFNDPVSRNGIFVELTTNNAAPRRFQVVFQQNPRKLQLQELASGGGSGAVVNATFVAIN